MTSPRSYRPPQVALHFADGTSAVVAITNPDRLRWDMEAPRRGWGKAADVPTLAQTFVGWAAAKREKATDLTWEQFQAALIAMEDVEEPADEVGPTTRTPGLGSS